MDALFAQEFKALMRDFQSGLLEFGALQVQHAVGEVFIYRQLVSHLFARG